MFSCSSKTVANVRLSLGIHVLIAHKFIPLTWGSVPGNPALAGQTGEKLRSVPGNPALAGQTGLAAGGFAAANQKKGKGCDGQQ